MAPSQGFAQRRLCIQQPGFRKAAGPKPHDHKGPTRLEQTHRSLALSGNVERVVGTSLDFHGDGVADGEVEVVLSERELLGGGESTLFEQGFEFGFPYPAVAGAGEPAPTSVLMLASWAARTMASLSLS